MDFALWIVVGVVLVALYLWYASIVRRRNRVDEALAGIDVQLQQRHDLIPNVLMIARRFMEHERALLNEITALRAQGHQQLGVRDFGRVAEKFDVEARLGQQMGRLLMLAENYPQLKSDGLAQAVRTALGKIERRTMFTVWGAGTGVTFVGVVLLSIADSPDVLGVLRGLGVGLFTALLFAVAVGSLLVSAYRARPQSPRPQRRTGELDRALAPVLRELDAIRAEISRKVRQRSVLRVPLGIAAAVGL